MKKTGVIIPAGGSGSGMGTAAPKQFLMPAGLPVPERNGKH